MNFKTLILQEEKKYLKYWPVAILYFVSIFLSLTTTYFSQGHLMSHFMGWTLILFGILKLEDIKSFATGFRKYDLFADQSELYAKLYPALEILLGVLFLLELFIFPVTILVLVIYLSTVFGILTALSLGEKIDCLCLGARFKLPLSIIAMFEAAVMIGMAVWMLLM